jgi:lipoate-protein ligase A
LHARDLTYAVIAPTGTLGLPDDLAGSYAWIRTRLLAGLNAAGFEARAARAQPGAARLDLCFAGATGFEVELEGRKLIGSAQRRTPLGFLQHGSIRIADDSALYRALTGSALAPAAQVGLDANALRAAIVQSFAAALGGPLELALLSPAERARAEAHMARRRLDRLAAPSLSLRRLLESADTVA